MKANWLVTGGKAEIKGETFKYIPQTIKNKYGQDENVPAFIKSNIDFENGEISFKVSLKEPLAMCQLIFSSDTGGNLNIGINTNERLFGITKYNFETSKWDLIAGSGSNENVELKTDYNLKITIYGSVITLLVNDIKVAEAIQEVRQSQLQIAFSSSDEIILKDFKVTNVKPKAFVIMQFSEEYNELYKEVIKPVCEEYGLECERADDFFTTNVIIQDIIQSIVSASVIIAEITPDNPNVFYEVGYSHAIGKPTILLCDRKRDKLPFDLSSFRTLFYENSIAGKTRVEEKLRKYLENIF